MRFQFEGKSYVIEFQHTFKQVTCRDRGGIKQTRSKYPYTRVSIRQVVDKVKREDWPEVYTFEVGCFKGDSYSKALGNLFALRGLTRSLQRKVSQEFRKAMWNAYLTRGEAPAKVETTAAA